MPLDFDISLFIVEFGLIALTLGCVVLDIFIKNGKDGSPLLANTGLVGVALLFLAQITQWGHFGTSLNGSFAQDGMSYYFKLLFFLAAFFTLFMTKGYRSKLKRGHGEFVLLILF